MVDVCSFLVVFLLLIMICYFTSIAGTTCKLIHKCKHNEYTNFFKNCTFMKCSPCPGCKKGMGLKKECGKPIIFNASDVLCIPCINGSTFNAVDELKGPCKACDNQKHRKVISQCSKMNNTKYADACDAGYYFTDGNIDPCSPCSCCIKGVKKCHEATNVQCTCPEIPSTTETSPATKSTDITTHNNRSTVKHDSKAAGSSSSVPNWVIPVVASVSSILVILGILGMAVYYRRNYASGGSTEGSFGSGDEVSFGSGNELIEGRRTNSVQANQQAPRIPQNVPDCKVSEMPFLLKSYLSLELDLKESYKANWRDVGKSLKLTKEQLKGLEIVSQKQDGSPAESMFTMLDTRGSDEPSVKDLVKVLIELGRSDIVENWDWEVNK